MNLIWLQDFNFGVELVLLISFIQSAFGGPAEDALESLKRLTAGFPSLIVQSTQGENQMKMHFFSFYFSYHRFSMLIGDPCSVLLFPLENYRILGI